MGKPVEGRETETVDASNTGSLEEVLGTAVTEQAPAQDDGDGIAPGQATADIPGDVLGI